MIINFAKVAYKIAHLYVSKFYPPEVVVHGSETQLQMGKVLNFVM